MEAVTMTAILTSIGEFFTQVVAWMGDILDVIASEPVLVLMVLAIPICGFVVGYLRRLISLN